MRVDGNLGKRQYPVHENLKIMLGESIESRELVKKFVEVNSKIFANIFVEFDDIINEL